MSAAAVNDWTPCLPGEFRRLAVRLVDRHRRRRVLLGAAGAWTVVMLFVVSWLFAPHVGEYSFAGIQCARVLALAEAFRAGALEEALSEQVCRHVAKCPRCGPCYRKWALDSVVQRRTPMPQVGPQTQRDAFALALGLPTTHDAPSGE